MNASWLLAMQARDGSWSDFWIPSGSSSEWVTAYVAASLAISPDAACRDAARAAWQYLVGVQHDDGGWGYGPTVPSDGDSTAWALILAQRIGERRAVPALRAFAFLADLRRCGGVATYGDARAIRRYVGAHDSADFSGWLKPHACVTAAAAQVEQLNAELRNDLLATQRPDGSWQGYWWSEPAYATALSVVALTPPRSKRERVAVAGATLWARRRIARDVDASAFASALLLTIFARGSHNEREFQRCAAMLESARAPSGRWRGSARLRVPAPHLSDPESVTAWQRWWGTGCPFNVYSIDQCSIFTTATAHYALAS